LGSAGAVTLESRTSNHPQMPNLDRRRGSILLSNRTAGVDRGGGPKSFRSFESFADPEIRNDLKIRIFDPEFPVIDFSTFSTLK
jgi:hypothetical protein